MMLRTNWIWIAVVLAIALAGLVAASGPASWAAPGHDVPADHPLWQTVPPPPPTDDGDDDQDEDEDEDQDGDDDTASSAAPTATDAPPPPPVAIPVDGGSARFPNTRLGVAVVNQPITRYDIGGLNVGWYMNYATADAPLRPQGIEFVQTVRVHQNKSGPCQDCYTRPYTYTMRPDAAILVARVAANPGATWVIGNEIDRRDWEGGGQDEITPEVYARAYGEVRALIKGADSTARVAIGGVMQATPLRLRYLDLIWDGYAKVYGRRLGDDVDVWNVHNFVLREERNSWGAGIPPGLADSQGVIREPEDNDDMKAFKENVVRFRTWMRDRGERDKPLYVTEFGINMPAQYIPADRVKRYMGLAFDYLLSAADPELGYPPDDNRLVQRFLWYSLDDSQDSPSRVEPYADALYSSVSGRRLEYGDTWAAYVSDGSHAAASTPRLNLKVAGVSTLRPSGAAADRALTLQAQVYNSGNTSSWTADGITVRFWDGKPGEWLIGEQVLVEVPGGGAPVVLRQPWVAPGPGGHLWTVEVESLPGEESWEDNTMAVSVEAGG